MTYLKILSKNVFTNHIYLINMYKQDLAFNNLQWSIPPHQKKKQKQKQKQQQVNH